MVTRLADGVSWPAADLADRVLEEPSFDGFVIRHRLPAAFGFVGTRLLLDDGDLPRAVPLGEPPALARGHSHAAHLTLAPADFLSGLTRHYLHAVLNEVLYSSLMAENRQRQAHMDRALQRLEEETGKLRLDCNRRRQEEITEEIEVILLSAQMMGLAGQPQ